MKLKTLDYNEIIESFTNRYENIIRKMRFQQRQQQERDQRKVELIAAPKASVVSSSGRPAAGGSATSTAELSDRLNAASLSSTLGAGKVRQMFDERRHRVAGIDKSYPLQPIPTATAKGPSVASGNHVNNGGSVARGTTTAGTAAASNLNNKTRVPPISANTRNRLMHQRTDGNGNGVQALRSGTGDVGGYDDNDNLLEDEKFPDAITIDDELLYANGNGGEELSARKLPHQNVNSVKLKPVPGRTPAKTTPATKKQPSLATTTTSASLPRTIGGGSAKTTSASSRTAPRTIGSSRTASSPSPANSAGPRKPSTAAAATAAPMAPVPDGLTRCDICARNFATDRIAKHREICQKTTTKKRKIFDATKHRVQGTDAEKYILKGPKKGAAKKSTAGIGAAAATVAGKKSDWRRKHEEFIAAIKAAKEMKAHLAKGGKLSDLPPPPPSENPDYVQCPHCSRRFNQTAAERHIPKCATMLHNKPKAKPSPAIRRH